MDFLINLFSVISASSSRPIWALLFGIASAILTFWGWNTDTAWLVLFGQGALAFAGVAAGLGAKSGAVASIIAIFYFFQSILFTETVHKGDEYKNIIENCKPDYTNVMPESCPLYQD